MEILVKETMVSTKALRHEGLFLLSIYLSIFAHVPVFFHSFSMLIPTRRSINQDTTQINVINQRQSAKESILLFLGSSWNDLSMSIPRGSLVHVVAKLIAGTERTSTEYSKSEKDRQRILIFIFLFVC